VGLAVRMISLVAMEINEKIRSSETTQAMLEEGRGREILAKYVTKERVVILQVQDIVIKIIGIKSMIGKLKADIYVLSDSILFILRRTAKVEGNSWIESFDHLCWPMRLLWPKPDLSIVGGPMFAIKIKINNKNEVERKLRELGLLMLFPSFLSCLF
jgi:hypothetical protein